MRISDWSSDVSLPICRAAWHQSGRTLANLPVHERRERRLVETAVAKWCHKRRDGTLKHGIAPSPRPQIRYHAPMLLRARILAPDKDANPLLSRRLRRLSTLLLLGLSGFALTAASVTPQAAERYQLGSAPVRERVCQ